MIKPEIQKRVCDLLSENLHRTKVFEKYQIDYFCKGELSLEKICEEISVELGDRL